MTGFEYALTYVFTFGFSVYPVQSPGKTPHFRLLAERGYMNKKGNTGGWDDLQHTRPTKEDLIYWFRDNPEPVNIAVITGKVSRNLVDVEFDDPEYYEKWAKEYPEAAKSPTVKSARGYHVFFRLKSAPPSNFEIWIDDVKVGDVRGEGGSATLPPSLHASGVQYEWVIPPAKGFVELESLDEVGIAKKVKPPKDLPATRATDTPYGKKALKNARKELLEAPEGTRNNTLNTIAYSLGRLVGGGELARETVEEVLMATALEVGLSDTEAQATIQSGLDAGVQEPRSVTAQSQDYIKALEALGYTFRLNEMNDNVEVNGEPISDPLAAKIRTQMRDIGFIHVNIMEDAYRGHAYDNRYHPIREYLEGLEWDGEDHIAKLAGYFVDKHPPVEGYVNMFHLWFKLWALGAVERVFNGKQNPVLVLEGGQELGKSTFVKWLASGVDHRFFYEGPINPTDKDDYVRLMSVWLWEVRELGATTKRADVEALKGFITVELVTVRKSYGRYDTIKPSLASFIGTINNDGGFLLDKTGNRRYLIVALDKINWAYSQEVDPNQVWAQALALYKAGERNRLDDIERELRDAINEEYLVIDPMEEMLQEYFDLDPNSDQYAMRSLRILQILADRGLPGGVSRPNSMNLASTLKRLGFEKAKEVWYRGSKFRGYWGIKPKEGTPEVDYIVKEVSLDGDDKD